MTEQKVTLITGASKGIGLATAKILAERGHLVLGVARTEPADFPGEFVKQDLADRAGSARVFQKLAEKHSIGCVVNNVGIVRPAPLEDVRVEDLMAVLDINLACAVQAVQAALPAMKKARWGRVVNISSLTAAGVPHRTSYAASKTALISFTRSWALELADQGITVNSIAPGPTNTEMFNTNNPPGSESRIRYESWVPMKRVADPKEIAAVIAFFLSEESSFITGQNLFVDGGASVGHAPV
jgi:NAD(P)-dependent dehydrogenase (short-subunit alcohol dehydrogenase family)